MAASSGMLNESTWKRGVLGEGRFPGSWPKILIPTAQRYIEALILHWVQHRDTEKELCWYFRLQDTIDAFENGFHGQQTLNRMGRPFREMTESLDFCDTNDGPPGSCRWTAGIKVRDILEQAARVLGKRAAGPLSHPRYIPHLNQ